VAFEGSSAAQALIPYHGYRACFLQALDDEVERRELRPRSASSPLPFLPIALSRHCLRTLNLRARMKKTRWPFVLPTYEVFRRTYK
jgi:hypothetical protein